MKKRNFILLEIMIGLTLLSILLTFLFHAMSQGIKMEMRVDEARKILFKRQHLQSRLQDLFLSLTPNRLPPLYTKLFPNEKKESLILYFDHGIDPDPQFSGPLLGRIYLEGDGKLVLAMWPLEKESKKWRKEILLDGVDYFQFQFLGQKEKKEDDEIGPNFAWHKMWPKNRGASPSILRLTVSQNEVESSFAFFLSKGEPFITYWHNS